MALSTRQRWSVLGGALALTLALAAWLGNGPEEPAEVPVAKPPAAANEKAPGPTQSGRVGHIAGAQGVPGEAAGQAGEITDLFAAQSWHAAPQTQAAGSSAPETPALPFTYFGKLIDGKHVTVYLASQDRNLAVRRGDVIDGTWRVESIGSNAMVFRYLPMGTKQTLEIGRTK